jgi:transposase-like protein/IS1 family transposase
MITTTERITCCGRACQSFGKHRNGLRRFRCPICKKTRTEEHTRTLGTMYISQDRAVMALQLLIEGNSIRSTQRITGMDQNTITALLVRAGQRCRGLLLQKIEGLTVKDVSVDEIWGFVQKKEGHRRPDEQSKQLKIGDAWCFVALENNTKLVLAWQVSKRGRADVDRFLGRLRYATSDQPFQLTTDGYHQYARAVTAGLRGRADYAQLIKVYGTPREGEQRYSPGEVIRTEVVPVMGNPDPKRICTSHVERQNLTIRQSMRRMTRLTLSFSKKWEHLEAAYALHFAYYNFSRIHRTLRVTPAMEQGITDHVWTIAELIS